MRAGKLSSCNQETLTGAVEWTGGEIPAGAFVYVHFVPGRREHDDHGHWDIQFNLLRVVVLATKA